MTDSSSQEITWTSYETYPKSASWEGFVSRQEILNRPVIIVWDCDATECFITTLTAELTLTVTHHPVWRIITSIFMIYSSNVRRLKR